MWGASAKHARGQKVGLEHTLEDEDGTWNPTSSISLLWWFFTSRPHFKKINDDLNLLFVCMHLLCAFSRYYMQFWLPSWYFEYEKIGWCHSSVWIQWILDKFITGLLEDTSMVNTRPEYDAPKKTVTWRKDEMRCVVTLIIKCRLVWRDKASHPDCTAWMYFLSLFIMLNILCPSLGFG